MPLPPAVFGEDLRALGGCLNNEAANLFGKRGTATRVDCFDG
jgi:hypothetical protein